MCIFWLVSSGLQYYFPFDRIVLEFVMIEVLNSKLEYVWENNQCERTFVFVHGFNSYHQKFTHLFKELIIQKEYNYLAFNLPGHGYSQADDKEISFKYYIDVATELVRSLGIKNITLLGHSMGGGVAMGMSTRLEAQIESVILVGTISRWPQARKELLARVFMPQDIEGLKTLANLLFYYGEHVYLDPAVKATAERELELFKQDTKRSQQMQLLIKDLLTDEETEDVIEEGIIKSKKLYLVYGEGDRVIDQHTIKEYFLKHNPNCEITVLERCGHTPWDENREGFGTYLESIL